MPGSLGTLLAGIPFCGLIRGLAEKAPVDVARPRTPVVVGCLSGSLFGAPAGKLVGPFVLGVSRMTLEPKPLRLVAPGCRIEPLPEIRVLDRLLLLGLPPIVSPSGQPLGDASPWPAAAPIAAAANIAAVVVTPTTMWMPITLSLRVEGYNAVSGTRKLDGERSLTR